MREIRESQNWSGWVNFGSNLPVWASEVQSLVYTLHCMYFHASFMPISLVLPSEKLLMSNAIQQMKKFRLFGKKKKHKFIAFKKKGFYSCIKYT